MEWLWLDLCSNCENHVPFGNSLTLSLNSSSSVVEVLPINKGRRLYAFLSDVLLSFSAHNGTALLKDISSALMESRWHFLGWYHFYNAAVQASSPKAKDKSLILTRLKQSAAVCLQLSQWTSSCWTAICGFLDITTFLIDHIRYYVLPVLFHFW